MGYICKNCGQQDRFNATQEVTQYVTEQIYIDGEGDINDYGDSDVNDSDSEGGPENVECSECDSDDCEWVDDDDEIAEILQAIELLKEEASKPSVVTNWKEELKAPK